jgi:hypothetical protein
LTARILFLDLSTNFGWAAGPVGEKPASGFGRFGEKGASQAALAADSMRQFTKLIREQEPTVIAFEAPMAVSLMNGKTNVSTTEILMGLPFALQGMARLLGQDDPLRATVGQIRSQFIGKNMKADVAKPMTWDKCLRLGWLTVEDKNPNYDRSDALAGWSYVETLLFPKHCQPIDDLFIHANRRRL